MADGGEQSMSLNPPIDTTELPEITISRNITLHDFEKPSISLNDEELFPRESLGILSTSFVGRDSLTARFLDSEELLNLSATDLNRQFVTLFNINSSPTNNVDTYNIFNSPLRQISSRRSSAKIEDNGSQLFNKGLLSDRWSSNSVNPSLTSCSPDDYSISLFSSIYKTVDPLNEAFLVSLSDGSTHYINADRLENIRNRIQSLPLSFKLHTRNELDNISLSEGLKGRGICGENDLDDSVFLTNNSPINEDTSFHAQDQTFYENRYLLDCTPEPEWDEWDSSKSNAETENKQPALNKSDIFKMVHKMFGTQPVKEDGENSSKNSNKCESPINDHLSQNVSQTSRATQCSLSAPCTDLSEDRIKISQSTNEHLLILVRKLFDIAKKAPTVADRNEARSIFKNITCLLEDGGDKVPRGNTSTNSLPSNMNKNSIKVSNPPESTESVTNHSNMALLRQNSKIHTGEKIMKREPLRAVLPVECMVKNTKIDTKSTPDKKIPRANRTSTQWKQSKLQPTATSTPTVQKFKENVSPSLSKSKLTRSNSDHHAPSTGKATNTTTSKDKICSGFTAKPRSFSVGKDSKISSALSRVRQNILNSPYYKRSSSFDGHTFKSIPKANSVTKCSTQPNKLVMGK